MVPSPERPTVEIIETKLDTYLHYMYNIYIYTYIFIMKGLVVLQNSTSFLLQGIGLDPTPTGLILQAS